MTFLPSKLGLKRCISSGAIDCLIGALSLLGAFILAFGA